MSNNTEYLGRYTWTPYGITDLGEDKWERGTQYRIVPFKSTKEQFVAKCVRTLFSNTPKDIFLSMTGEKAKDYYVPMMVYGNKLICLHSQIPELSYEFLKDGTCDMKNISPSEYFDPNKIDASKYHFLGIWLSLHDANYIAQYHNLSKVCGSPTVIFMPIHTFEFDYQNKHYKFISYGDEGMNNFYTNHPIPNDNFVNGKKLIINRAWLSITAMCIMLAAVIFLTFDACLEIWEAYLSFDYLVPPSVQHLGARHPELYKLINLSIISLIKIIILCVFSLIIYYIAWILIKIAGYIFKWTLLHIDIMLVRLVQMLYIRHNYNKKLSSLNPGYQKYVDSHINIKSIDTTAIKKHFELFLKSIDFDIKALIW